MLKEFFAPGWKLQWLEADGGEALTEELKRKNVKIRGVNFEL